MSLLLIFVAGKAISSFGLGLVYWYLFRHYRERFIGFWTLSWFLLAARMGLDFLRFSGYDQFILLFFNGVTSLLYPLFLIWGTSLFAGKKISKGWTYSATGILLFSLAVHGLKLPLPISILPINYFVVIAELFTGITFIRLPEIKGLGKYVSGYGFVLIGLLNLSYTFEQFFFPENTVAWKWAVGSLLELIIMIGILLTYFQKIRQELSDSEKRFRLLTDNAKDIVYRYAFAPELGFEYISPAATAILGCTPEQFYSNAGLAQEMVHPEDRSLLPCSLEQEDWFSRPHVLRVNRSSEQQVWLELQNVPVIDELGRVVAVEGIARDITERKLLEQQMVRLDQLRIMGQTAASIVHEIRNPMTTVRGFLQILQEKQDYAQFGTYLGLMIDELDRANSIITDYLSMSREKRLELRTLSLNKVVMTVISVLENSADGFCKRVELQLADIPDLSLDEKEIRQLLLNLVNNALDAMPYGGKVKIITYVESEDIVLAVEDEGTGIQPEIIEKLGTPFFTTKECGTGLGLSVCYNIAERHKADIKIKTGPTGTTFFVRFKPQAAVGQ